MRMKSFSAASMDEALAEVRRTLGDEAIIVSSHESERGRGVQVTAAIEDEEELQAAAAALAELRRDPEDQPIGQALSYHGAPAGLIARIAKAADRIETNDEVEQLAAALDRYMLFDRLQPSAGRIAFVGPPGAGKTAACVKMAADYVLREQPVRLVSTDTVKAGALDQLSTLAGILDRPCDAAALPDDLAAIVAATALGSAIMIDTPGTNPYLAQEIDDLGRFLTAIACEPILVLSAGTDAEEAAECARVFAGLGCRRLIVTRMDAARRFGAVLAAAEAGHLSIAGVGISASMAVRLRPLNPMSLARLLLHDPGQFCSVRDLGADAA